MNRFIVHAFAAALLLLSTTRVSAEDFSAVNNEGITIYYNYLNGVGGSEVAVTFRGSYYDEYYDEYTGDVVIPETVMYGGNTYAVKTIGNYAFAECFNLNKVTICNAVTLIGEDAFSDCTGLTSVNISDSVRTIGNAAFDGCTGLTAIVIPDSVRTIGNYAFDGCYNLTSVYIGAAVKTIGIYAFSSCRNLHAVIIPDSVTIIGDNAFYCCYLLESLTIGNAVRTIGNYAFAGCYLLTSVIIPDSVRTIGNYAFETCYLLASVAIGNAVTTIGEYAFSYCIALKSVTLPNAVTTIGKEAFASCDSITYITSHAINPPQLGANVFYKVSTTIPVQVPCAGLLAYQTATGWSDFSAIWSHEPYYDVTVQSDPTVMGTANVEYSCTAGIATYKAEATIGYRFTQWNDDNIDNPRTVTVTQDTALTAMFAPDAGIATIKQTGISVYPNPVENAISIVLPEHTTQASFRLYDMQGRLLLEQTLTTDEQVVVSHLSSGIYLYTMDVKGKRQIGKIVKR